MNVLTASMPCASKQFSERSSLMVCMPMCGISAATPELESLLPRSSPSSTKARLSRSGLEESARTGASPKDQCGNTRLAVAGLSGDPLRPLPVAARPKLPSVGMASLFSAHLLAYLKVLTAVSSSAPTRLSGETATSSITFTETAGAVDGRKVPNEPRRSRASRAVCSTFSEGSFALARTDAEKALRSSRERSSTLYFAADFSWACISMR
mmetsp:Transcript_55027/g.98087  ORF Transcript_55027/g.98087 Transcript_55027/m.98087 type:complete len:210 (-) Transcript_55027:980-1609(-)